MEKLLLWVSITVFGAAAAGLVTVLGAGLGLQIVASTVGSIAGIVLWHRYLRFV